MTWTNQGQDGATIPWFGKGEKYFILQMDIALGFCKNIKVLQRMGYNKGISHIVNSSLSKTYKSYAMFTITSLKCLSLETFGRLRLSLNGTSFLRYTFILSSLWKLFLLVDYMVDS